MKKVLAIVLVLMCLAICAAMAETPETETEEEPSFTRFWFTRGGYMPSESVEIFTLDGNWYLCRNEGPAWKIGPEEVKTVDDMIRGYNVLSWDGFKGVDEYVLDGEGFSMRIEMADGTEISASGDNMFPEGYWGVTTELYTFFGEDAFPEKPGIAGTYVYATEDGKEITITVNEDKTYRIDGEGISLDGTWFIEGSRFYTSGKEGYWFSNEFIPVEDALYYADELSDGFEGAEVPDLARFEKQEK